MLEQGIHSGGAVFSPCCESFFFEFDTQNKTFTAFHKEALLLTFHVKLSALVVEAMRYLVPNHPTDGAVIRVTRPVVREKYTLQDPRRKLDRVLQRAVERVHHCRTPVPDPIRLVDLLKNIISFMIRRQVAGV